MSITAFLDLTISADAAAEAPEVLRSVLAATRAFAGNEGVEVLVDADDPTHIVVVEKWESLAHDEAYRAWRATPAGASTLGSILAAVPTLTKFEDTGI